MQCDFTCACRVPFEVKTVKDKSPVYELNLEDLGRPNDQPSLPFNAFGTLAWARAEFDNNSASSQARALPLLLRLCRQHLPGCAGLRAWSAVRSTAQGEVLMRSIVRRHVQSIAE